MNWAKFDADRATNDRPRSADKLAERIRGSAGRRGVSARPGPVSHAPVVSRPVESRSVVSRIEGLASRADEATRQALAHPSPDAHEAAEKAHREVIQANIARGPDMDRSLGQYHQDMTQLHRRSNERVTPRWAENPSGVTEEHTDEHAARFNNDPHHLASSFMDTEARHRSDHNYDGVARVGGTAISADQRHAVNWYTYKGDRAMNRYLRGSGKMKDPAKKAEVEKGVSDLDGAMRAQAPLAHDMVTYRGVTEPEKMFGEVGSMVGGEFQDRGYSSTTTHAHVANQFSGLDAMIRVLSPKGSRLLKPSDVGHFGDNERELLVPRGTRYHVAADRMVMQHNGIHRRVIDLVRLDS